MTRIPQETLRRRAHYQTLTFSASPRSLPSGALRRSTGARTSQRLSLRRGAYLRSMPSRSK